MDLSLINNNPHNDRVAILQGEIAELEAEIERVRQTLMPFESQIRSTLHKEIIRLKELNAIYKKQKDEKKELRLEQKKRGKNYQAFEKSGIRQNKNREKNIELDSEQKELRRLYKEAIVQVHPDKIEVSGEHDKIKETTEITAMLNEIYKKGDLESLISFYRDNIKSPQFNVKEFVTTPIIDLNVRLSALKKKKLNLADNLEEIKSSFTYHVLMTYPNPLKFIDELHQQFMERIVKLEKRTRKVEAITNQQST